MKAVEILLDIESRWVMWAWSVLVTCSPSRGVFERVRRSSNAMRTAELIAALMLGRAL